MQKKLNLTRNISLFLLALVLLPPHGMAKIYKWVDKDGKVHYSDKPVKPDSKEVKVDKAPSEKARAEAKARADRLIELQNRRMSIQQDAEKDKQTQQEKQDKQAKKCNEARAEIALLKMQIRIVDTDKDGKEKFVSDEERKKRIETIEGYIAKNCK